MASLVNMIVLISSKNSFRGEKVLVDKIHLFYRVTHANL